MSLTKELRGPLAEALDCARRIAEIGLALLDHQEPFREQVRLLRRDLPHLNQQVMAVFRGDERHTAKLQHVLDGVQEDAFNLADWAGRISVEIQKLHRALGESDADAGARYGQFRTETFSEYERLRQAVLESCSRAHLKAEEVCAASERAAEELPPATAPAGAEPPAQPAHATKAPNEGKAVLRDKRAEARDKWLYQQVKKGDKTYRQIMLDLVKVAKSKGWRKVGSPQAIEQAAERYVKRHNLPPLPPRIPR